jgi:hypothetical protein
VKARQRVDPERRRDHLEAADQRELKPHHRQTDEPESGRQLDHEPPARRRIRQRHKRQRGDREEHVEDDPSNPGQGVLHKPA